MLKYLLSRMFYSVALLFGVLFLVFMLLHITGDPVSLMVSRHATPAEIEALRQELGFDRPLLVQFAEFVKNALQGDFGRSFRYRQPAMDLVVQRIPATIELASVALFMAILMGVTIGILGGSNPNTALDSIARGLGLLGQTIPTFWLGLILIIIFSLNLGWFPAYGRETFKFIGLTLPNKSIILPAFALSLFTTGQLARFTRSAVLEVMNEEYVTTARSKGLKKMRIYSRYILKNSAIPLISIIGVQFSYLLSGSIYIETIFSWPGLGNLLAEAVSTRDFFLVQATAFFTSFVVIGLHLVTDIIYMLVDPRIRYR
ncbi:MAG: ABC transporter permease [Dethiobacteria bacterium]|nr:ABC transporter permease [Bacillota bacterium]MDW7728651.1 ABC transporter permease [Bacillota bacterium]